MEARQFRCKKNSLVLKSGRLLVIGVLLATSLIEYRVSSAVAAVFYSTWATETFGTNSTYADPMSDPDQDGQINLVEFVFGTDPLVPNHSNFTVPRVLAAEGSWMLIGIECVQWAGERGGVCIDPVVSDNLQEWIRPWWLRYTTNSLAGDPPGADRRIFLTWLPLRSNWFVRWHINMIDPGPLQARYYVATNGNDSNPGTNFNAAFATLAKAVSVANPGDLIYIRGGVYKWSSKVSITRSGTPANPIRLWAYPGETPVLDFLGEPLGTRGIELKGNWWHIRGLVVKGAGDNGLYISGASNTVEQCVVLECRDSGFQLDSGAKYNLILNCDSYRNYDPNNYGENADGFAAKFAVGPGNAFFGCRAWENSDDGWDLWEATNSVTIVGCWAWRNGVDIWGVGTNFAGDGNGFKLGGNYKPGAHVVRRCVAFFNAASGFDQNNNTAGLVLEHNTGYANTNRNFYLNHGTNITAHVLKNNLSIAGGRSDTVSTNSIQLSNSWQIIQPAPSAADVWSTDPTVVTGQRYADGRVPEDFFLRPRPGGRLVNVGAIASEPWFGAAPDLGAFETPEW